MKLFKKTISTGDLIGVIMDTTTGKLSFAVNGNDFGVAYENIPCDILFVPCVILKNRATLSNLLILKRKNTKWTSLFLFPLAS